MLFMVSQHRHADSLQVGIAGNNMAVAGRGRVWSASTQPVFSQRRDQQPKQAGRNQDCDGSGHCQPTQLSNFVDPGRVNHALLFRVGV